MDKHNCDNVNCNHNDTKGMCCLYNPDNCKYRQLQKENAELKEQLRLAKEMPYSAVKKSAEEKTQEQLTKAKEIIEKVAKMYRYSSRVEEIIEQAEQFLNSEVEK